MTYSPRGASPQYHRRWSVSRCCSAWEAVGPLRTNHRENRGTGRAKVRQKSVSSVLGFPAREVPDDWSVVSRRLPSAARRRAGGDGQALGRCAPVGFNGYPLSTSGRLYPVLSRGPYPDCSGERTHLEDGFALRCCQRLSGPDLATRRLPRVG